MAWYIVYAAAVFSMAWHWNQRSAVGGGLTLGLVVGVILAVVRADWWMIANAAAIGVLVGTVLEVCFGVTSSSSRRSSSPSQAKQAS